MNDDDDGPSSQGAWLMVVGGGLLWALVYWLAHNFELARSVAPSGGRKASAGYALFGGIAQAVGTSGALVCGLLTVGAGVFCLWRVNGERVELAEQREKMERRARLAQRRAAQESSDGKNS